MICNHKLETLFFVSHQCCLFVPKNEFRRHYFLTLLLQISLLYCTTIMFVIPCFLSSPPLTLISHSLKIPAKQSIVKFSLSSALLEHGNSAIPLPVQEIFSSASVSSLYADPSAFSFLIRSCASVSHLDFGTCLHGYLTKCGFMSCFNISTSLIAMYLKFGKNVGAYQLFEEMPSREKKFYDFAVCRFGSGRFFEETLLLFEEILALDLLSCLEAIHLAVVACGELSRLDKWQWFHSFIVDHGLDRNPLNGNSLISMYIKMERLDLACCIFNAMEERDLVSWNSFIRGYAQARN